MSTPTPFEDTWKMIQETSRLLKEQGQETDRRFQETDRRFQETDRRFQETDRRFRELTERLAQETARQSQEAERRSQEAERRSQEAERRSRELDKQIGRLGNRLGDFVQEMVAPSVVQLFAERGLQVHQLARNVQAKRNGQAMQVDLMVMNDDTVILVEVKSALSVDDVNEHLQRLAGFKTVFPRYTDARVMGAVAAMVIPDHVAGYAYHQGLFVLGQRGETMQILNDAQFQPRTW
ncbi:MAG: hypothetical protein U1F76_25075 [Candidatus Competibacteraceae bacterium]